MASAGAASSLAPSALHARVQKLLSSRAELESTKALLSTLVASDARPASPLASSASPSRSSSLAAAAAGAAAPRRSLVVLDVAHGQSLAELRKSLRASLEQKQLALAESALAGLAQTLEKIAALKGNVDALDAKSAAVQTFLESTKRETQQVQAEAAALAAKKTRVQEELDDVKQFLAKYQLTDDEIQALYAKTLGDEDMAAFFPVMERVQQVKADCRSLVADGEVTCALELLDTVGKYQEVGFERLYQWTTKKCAEVDGEPSSQLQRAIALLRDRPEFYNDCKESLAASRRSLVVRRFIIALTRGGPNGIPRPIEMYAHDPVRYCGDMLAWVHQAIAGEHEFFRVLFDGDLEYTPSRHDASADAATRQEPPAAAAAAEQLQQLQQQTPSSVSTATSTSMVGRTFDGVARPLQVRIEQTLAAPHGIVIAYRLVHLLAFYAHKLQSLVAHSGVARALAACRDAANRAFTQQLQLLVDGVAGAAQDYAANLAATHAVLDVAHRLVSLLEVFQTSLLPDDETEADLAPLFEGVLPAIARLCERTERALDAVDALVFRVNNLSCVRAPLARFPGASKWYAQLGDELQQHLAAVSELQAQRLLERGGLAPILAKIHAIKRAGGVSASAPPTQQPGLDRATIARVLEAFSTSLMALAFPQLEHISQPDLREQARLLTATRLADAYAEIYAFVHDPASGYAGGVGGGSLLLHSPLEVRTVLEIE